MWIKDLFTEKDGISYCPVRIFFAIGFVVGVYLTLHDIFTIANFSFIEHAKDWFSGMAQYLGLGGAAVAGKNFSEKE